MEEHGRWDESLERFVCEVTSISTEGELTHQEGLEMYDTAKKRLARKGFIHAFVPDYSRKLPHGYQLCELEAASA